MHVPIPRLLLQELHIQELDNLEKVLDNALVRFETTTL